MKILQIIYCLVCWTFVIVLMLIWLTLALVSAIFWLPLLLPFVVKQLAYRWVRLLRTLERRQFEDENSKLV